MTREVKRSLDAMSERFGNLDASTIHEDEIARFADEYTPSNQLSPSFENLFGNILKGIRKVANKAVGLAKKGIGFVGNLTLGPIFKKLSALAPLLIRKSRSMRLRSSLLHCSPLHGRSRHAWEYR